MIERIITKLYTLKQRTFALSLLQNWCHEETYAAFTELVAELERREVITPVKTSRTNGCNPPLYAKYRILSPKEETQSFHAELDAMHYWINTDPFRKQLKKYQKHRKFLLSLSNFLKTHPDTLTSPMSENERAYAIWGDEKALDTPSHISLLKECGVWERLHTYPTPEPFFDYRKSAVPEHVLVIENKDTWFTMRKLMIESGTAQFFETPIDCLVYGEGNKITQRSSSLKEYLSIDKPFHGAVWYWGDLDPEGIGFFLSAKLVNAGLQLQPFLPAYQEMLRLFEQRLAAPHTEMQYHVRTRQKTPEQADAFYSLFPEHFAMRIPELLAQGYYIPQEILHYQLLKTYSRTEWTV
ncbi:MAG: hypothetical protein J5979_07980 [Lachnospiraceae bacterium]|nr:hypothetical protein [Lachnospiraceae bacterium]